MPTRAPEAHLITVARLGPVRGFFEHQPMTSIVDAIRDLITQRPVAPTSALPWPGASASSWSRTSFAMITHRHRIPRVEATVTTVTDRTTWILRSTNRTAAPKPLASFSLLESRPTDPGDHRNSRGPISSIGSLKPSGVSTPATSPPAQSVVRENVSRGSQLAEVPQAVSPGKPAVAKPPTRKPDNDEFGLNLHRWAADSRLRRRTRIGDDPPTLTTTEESNG